MSKTRHEAASAGPGYITRQSRKGDRITTDKGEKLIIMSVDKEDEEKNSPVTFELVQANWQSRLLWHLNLSGHRLITLHRGDQAKVY